MLGAKSMQCVNVCSVINPYLFWFTYNDDTTINKRQLLEKTLEGIYQYQFPSSSTNFSKGELVIVKHENTWKRATIEYILESEHVKRYSCWLIDHGILFDSDVVFKCFHRYDDPPYAKQAAINNIAFVEQKMDVTNNSIKLQKSKSSSPAIHVLIDEKITNNKSLFFAEEDSCQDILFGDIYYVDNGTMKSLRNALVEQQLAIIDPKGFQEAFSFKWIQNKCNYLSSLKHSVPDDKEKYVSSRRLHGNSQGRDNFDLRDLEKGLHDVEGTFRMSRRGISCPKNKERTPTASDTVDDRVCQPQDDANCEKSKQDQSEIKKKRQELLLKRHRHAKGDLNKENMESKVIDNKNDVCNKSAQCMSSEPVLEDQKLTPSKEMSNQSMENNNSVIETNKIVKSPSEGMAKNQFLHELFEKRKRRYQKYASKEQDTLDSESEFERSYNGSNDLTTSDIEDVTSATDATDGEEKPREPKHLTNIGGMVFTPAGASVSSHKARKCRDKSTHFKSADHDLSEFSAKINGVAKNCQETVAQTSDTSESNEPESQPEQNTNEKKESSSIVIEPKCKCKDCDFYTNSESWNIDYVCKRKTKKMDTGIRAPPLLKEDKTLIDAANVKLVNYKHLSKIQKLQLTKQIIHGTIIPRPLKYLSEATLNLQIHEALKKLDYKTCKKLQMYTLPAVLKSMNVCIVNGPQTGKTLGYLPPLCSFLMERGERYADVIKHKGPIVLILCTNSKQCEDVYDLIRVIFSCINRKPRMLTATYPLESVNFADVEVLITMPLVLATLLKSHIITLKRVCHIVLEDANGLLEKYKDLIDQILDVTQSMLQHRHCDLGVQLIATCTRWTLDVERVMKTLRSFPLICIGDHLEAIMYSRVSLYLQFVTRNEKIFVLLDIVKGKYKMHKTVVVCSNEEFDEVVSSLRQQGLDLVAIPENMPGDEIVSSESQWNSLNRGQYSVLICTDDALNSVLTITDARCLIHYSLPNTYTVFAKRLAVFSESLKCPLAAHASEESSYCHVLTDENCIPQIPRFLGFLQRMRSDLPLEFQAYLQKQEIIKEDRLISNKVKLCESLKQLGTCCHGDKCKKRHFLNPQLDICDNLPQNGKLKFKIANIDGVTKFRVVITQHVDVNNIVQNWSALVPNEVERDLTDRMLQKKVSVKEPKIGSWYAYRCKTPTGEMYHRCEVCYKCSDGSLIVKMLDGDGNPRISKEDLYELPEHFKSMPLKICQVYLANLMPPFGDDNFSNRACKRVRELLESVSYFNIIMSGDIYLQLGNAFWLKDVVYEIPVGGQVVTKLNLTQKLKEMDIVQTNEKHLVNLYKLCADAKIELPKYVSSRQSRSKQHEEQIKPQWAFMDSEKIHEATFAAAVSPSEVFVRLTKFEDLLKYLQKEIQEVIKNPLYNKQFQVKVGKCYLAKDPDGSEYCRVQILKLKDQKALCFYVDYGDEGVVSVSDVKYIPNHIISKLPFQSIRCRLYGLSPVGDTWFEGATDILYSYAYEPDSNIFRNMYLKTCVVEKMGITRKKYAVLLKEGFSSKQVLINEMLVECGMAKYNLSEPIVDFAIPKPVFDDDSDRDSDLDEIADIIDTTSKVKNNLHQAADFPGSQDLKLEDMEFVVFDNLSFLRDMRRSTEPVNHSNVNNNLPAIAPAKAVDYYTPDVLWSESEKNVKINIKVPNLTGGYQVKLVKDQYLTFRANVNGKQYSLKIVLFNKIKGAYQHSYVGQEVRIIFTKIDSKSWPRLMSSSKRMSNIHYDLSTLVIEEEKKKRLLDLGDESENENDNEIEDDVKYMDVSEGSSGSDYFEVESD